MTRHVLGALLAGLLVCPALADAQTPVVKHPDFTGSWKVTGIEMPQRPADGDDRGFGGGGGGGGRGGRGFGGGGRGRRGGGGYGGNGGNGGAPQGDGGDQAARPQRLEEGQTVRIRQTDDRLIVTEEASGGPVMSSFSFDGKEITNSAGNATTKSKTKWEGVAIVTDSTRTTDTGRGKFQMKSREIRSLSDDGRTMTVRTELDTPRGKQTMTVTYSKTGE
jgi:hypothetical protein